MRFAFVFSEIMAGLRRNVSMVISVVLVTFISLTFVGGATLLQLQIGHMKNYWYDRAQVAVYLCTAHSAGATCSAGEVTPAQIEAVKERLDSKGLASFIEKYYFENHEQAYANFKEQFRNSQIVDLTTPDQLNETFWIKLKDPSQSNQSRAVVEAFSGLAGVETVVDQRQYLDQIFSVLNIASLTAVAVAVLMLIAAALLIATTIRLSAFSRRRELGIMRLVGASNMFVQTPFVLEGVIAAAIGAVLASGVLLGVAKFFVADFLANKMPYISFVQIPDVLLVLPVLFVVGVVLATFSAKLSIARYLRV